MPQIVFTTWRELCEALIKATDFDPDRTEPAGTLTYERYGETIVHIEVKADLIGGKKKAVPF
jgi:hypothetical protein